MKFEIHETVQTPDPEVVLRALEMCSREVSSDVVRFGDRITVRGLGPSPRSKNKHDTTVFCVNAENNETVIQGEVNFQASALLGETSQQEVVRSKLNDLFEQMKAQIHLDSLRVAAYTAARRSASSSTTVLDRPEDQGGINLQELDPPEEKLWPSEEKIPLAAAPETVIEAMTAAPDAGWGAAALVGEPEEIVLPERSGESSHVRIAEPAAAPPVEHPLPDRPGVKNGPDRAVDSAQTAVTQAAESVRPTEAKQTPAKGAARNPVSHAKPDAESGPEEEISWAARIPPYRLQAEEDRTSGWKQFALGTTIVVMLLALAAGAYRLYWMQHKLTVTPVSSATDYVPPPAIQPPAVPAPLPVMPKAPEASASTPAKSDTSAETPASSAEVRRWLQGWAASMQTRDANAQASFYADKLDRYLDQRNVGRGAVLRDREATIRMRKGLWTVKMEDVVIEKQTDSEAEVRLMKHFIDQPEQSEILESYVPTHLTLKRINGQWKITSEQDQPTISVSPWKAQGGMLDEDDRPEIRDEQGSAVCAGACSS